jgi:eukaryotic-like serine/threonine-protein kinase
MDQERWEQISRIYQASLEVAEEERLQYLQKECAGDAALRAEVESLLSKHAHAGGFLAQPAMEAVARELKQGIPAMIGRKLGPYQVSDFIGAGGMGEVYKAWDLRLERIVALKILPPHLISDAEHLKWFRREAKAASALNHPNIATIHDIGEAEGFHFLIMEFVEGETLAARIRKGALELGEILDIGEQVSEALEEAHGKGIVHRDIKPANIMLSSKGRVKVLDFGLAKQVRQAGAEQSTASQTTPGLVMGTVEYMSPEQVLGQPVDHRTDLFSLGVTLYDMTAGRLPFQGTTPTETMDQILHGEPESLTRFNNKLPIGLEQIIKKCLEKDRSLRYQTASDVSADLKRLKRDTDSDRASVSEGQGKQTVKKLVTSNWKWAWAGLVLIILAGLGIAWLARWLNPRPTAPPELREVPLTNNSSEFGVGSGSISPDGKYLAYSDRRGMHLKLIESRDVRSIPYPEGSSAEDTEWLVGYWFPDSTKFLATRLDAAWNYSLWAISVLGGPPRLLREHAGFGPTSPDGSQIVYLTGAPNGPITPSSTELWLMGAQGENPHKFLVAAESESLDYMSWSPDGQRIVYVRYHGKEAFIESRNLKGEQLTTVLSDSRFYAWGLWWFPNGRLVFTSREPEPNQNDSSLWEIQVDPKTGRPLSQPRRITRWAGIYVEALNGTANGKRLAVIKRSSLQADVFVSEWEAKGRRLKNPRRLTFDERNDFLLSWTRDSKAVFFSSDRNGQLDIFKQALDQDTAEPIFTGSGNKLGPILSPDGNLFLFRQGAAGGKTRIMKAPVSGGPPEMVLEGKGINGIRCSSSPASLCVLGEESPDRKQYVFNQFDPMKGRGRVITRVTLQQPVNRYFWDLTRDGTQLAFAQNVSGSESRIQILPVSGGGAREVVIPREIQLTSLDWAIEGEGFFVGSSRPWSVVLLFVDMDGRTDVLWKRETLYGAGPRALPSPDGRNLAMQASSADSNIWMLENF